MAQWGSVALAENAPYYVPRGRGHSLYDEVFWPQGTAPVVDVASVGALGL